MSTFDNFFICYSYLLKVQTISYQHVSSEKVLDPRLGYFYNVLFNGEYHDQSVLQHHGPFVPLQVNVQARFVLLYDLRRHLPVEAPFVSLVLPLCQITDIFRNKAFKVIKNCPDFGIYCERITIPVRYLQEKALVLLDSVFSPYSWPYGDISLSTYLKMVTLIISIISLTFCPTSHPGGAINVLACRKYPRKSHDWNTSMISQFLRKTCRISREAIL